MRGKRDSSEAERLRTENLKLQTRVRELGRAESSLADLRSRYDQLNIDFVTRREAAVGAEHRAAKAEVSAAEWKRKFDDLEKTHSIVMMLVTLLNEVWRKKP